MEDIEAIAKGLTDLQRLSITGGCESGGDLCVFASRSVTMDSLVKKGLVRRRIGMANCLTPLGLEVRAHLERTAHD